MKAQGLGEFGRNSDDSDRIDLTQQLLHRQKQQKLITQGPSPDAKVEPETPEQKPQDFYIINTKMLKIKRLFRRATKKISTP